MKTKQGLIFGEPFSGFYDIKASFDLFENSGIKSENKVKERNVEFRKRISCEPIATWHDTSIQLEGVLRKIESKKELYELLKGDLSALHDEQLQELFSFLIPVTDLNFKGVDIETCHMDDPLIKQIEESKKSKVVRQYMAMSICLKHLEREIVELEIIAESLRNALPLDTSNFNLYQEDDSKQYRKKK